jgi:hypothetical protein
MSSLTAIPSNVRDWADANRAPSPAGLNHAAIQVNTWFLSARNIISLDQFLVQLCHAIPLPLPLLRLILQQALYAVERRRDCFEMLSIGHRARLAARSAARPRSVLLAFSRPAGWTRRIPLDFRFLPHVPAIEAPFLDDSE